MSTQINSCYVENSSFIYWPTEVCNVAEILQWKNSVGSFGNFWVPNREQAIKWTNIDQAH